MKTVTSQSLLRLLFQSKPVAIVHGTNRTAWSLIFVLTFLAPAAFAANTVVGWDANTGTTGAQDGGGTWDTGTANWWSGSADVLWPNTTSSTATLGTNSGAAGTITVSGAVTVNTIQFNAPGSGSYTLSGGTLSFGGTSPTINIAASQTPIINSVIGESTAGTVIKFSGTSASSGSITLGGANTFTGGATLSVVSVNFNSLANSGSASSFGSSGTVTVGNSSSFARVTYTGGAAGTDRLWNLGGAGGGIINNNGTGAISFNNTGNMMTGTGVRTLTLGGTYTALANTFAETISDLSPSVTTLIVGGNTWNITGANTHSGGTTLNGSGVLDIGNATALGAGVFTIGGNSSFDNVTAADLTVTNPFALSGGNPTYVGSLHGMTITGPVTFTNANRTITVSANTLTLGGAIGDDGTNRVLTKAGNGTLALTNVNTYNGGTILSAGTLAIAQAGSLGTGNGVTFSATATLQATATLTIPGTTTISLNGGADSFDNTAAAGNTFEVAAKITGTGGAVKRSSESFSSKGAIRFSNDADDYTGNFSQGYGMTEFTSVANGGSPSALGSAATAYAIGNGSSAASFRYVGSASTSTTRAIDWQGTVGSLILENIGGGTVQYLATGNLKSGLGSSGLTLQGTNTGNNTLAQVINDSGGTTTLTKAGSGTWVLTGANTYSGATTISGGALAVGVNGSISNTLNIVVAGGSTFDVSRLSSAFTLGTAQTLSNSTSTATINGNFNTGSGTNSLTFASGTPSLNVTNGTLTLSASTVFKVDNTGATLGAGNYKIVSKASSGSVGTVGGTVPALVAVGGAGATGPASLQIIGGELYLVVGATISALTSSKNPSGFYDSVIFSASVRTNGVTAGDASGTITFLTNGVAWGTNNVSGGSTASASIAILPRGTNLITTIYSGDNSYLGSTNSISQIVTNHPPLAGNMVVTRSAGVSSVRLAISDLLSNVTDADGDSVILVGAGVSTNGIAVTTVGTNYLYYNNTNNVSDQFSYTVTDGFGGTSTGLVSIVVSNTATGQITGLLTSFTGNVANLTFHGIPNYSYITERSTNLTDWVDVTTNIAATNGVISVSDSFGDLGGVPPASAYYRLKWQP